MVYFWVYKRHNRLFYTQILLGEIMHKFRDPVSGLTHLSAAVTAALGLVVLLAAGWGQPAKELSFLVYGISLVLMFSASALYHLARRGPKTLGVLRKIDHSAIYLLIAGTYTPVCLSFFGGFWRWGLLSLIWAAALIGVVVKVFVIKAPRWVTTGIYLLMGWFSILAVNEMLRTMPAGAIFWLVLGGLFFTAGAVIYTLKRPNPLPGWFGFHEIWHIFVILGCLSHFILVAGYAV
jgi:hemolysin III